MKVLVVDDEELVVEFLRRSLKADKHTVEIARNGVDAQQKAMHKRYDVIILDVILPKKSGIDVCKELRAANIHTPIIMLTSRQEVSARIEGLDVGADDYLIKPFKYPELEARLRALNRRPNSLTAETIDVGRLRIDTKMKTVLLDNAILDVRPKEYALLEYLMKHAGSVISKEELLENVWLISATNASNRLEVCLYHIRRKVNAKEKILKTIRGYGYIIEPATAELED